MLLTVQGRVKEIDDGSRIRLRADRLDKIESNRKSLILKVKNISLPGPVRGPGLIESAPCIVHDHMTFRAVLQFLRIEVAIPSGRQRHSSLA